MISIHHMSCRYSSETVIRDVSFTIGPDDFFIIIGPNGSGKTTLMRVLAGIQPAADGEVSILDRRVRSYARKALSRILAFVPQTTPVDFPFTVRDVVAMGRAPHLGLLGLETLKDRDRTEQAMAYTGVDHLAGRRLDQLSGGERQRVMISRAICQQPKIILLDEPTASLDLAHQIKVMDLMEQLQKDEGICVVMVSHDINLAAMYATRLMLLEAGRIRRLGTPDEVLTYQALERTYGCTILVDENPLGGVPRIIPVPRKFAVPTPTM